MSENKKDNTYYKKLYIDYLKKEGDVNFMGIYSLMNINATDDDMMLIELFATKSGLLSFKSFIRATKIKSVTKN